MDSRIFAAASESVPSDEMFPRTFYGVAVVMDLSGPYKNPLLFSVVFSSPGENTVSDEDARRRAVEVIDSNWDDSAMGSRKSYSLSCEPTVSRLVMTERKKESEDAGGDPVPGPRDSETG